MKKIFFIFFALHVALLITHSQPTITWNRLYDGGYNDKDYGYGFCRTSDGNYIIGGVTRYHGAAALKIDTYSNTVWLRHYSVTNGEAITATNDGGCLLVSPSFLKINSSGDSVWYRNYSSYGVTNLYDVIKCSDGGYFTCGRAYYDSGYVMKTDSLGNLTWNNLISHTSLKVVLYTVCEAFSGGYLVAGRQYNLNQFESIIAKFSYTGQRLWVRNYQEADSLGDAVRIVKDPPYYFIACHLGYMLIDENGNVVKGRKIQLGYSQSIFDLRPVTDDRLILIAQTYIMPNLTSRICISDSSGNIMASTDITFSDFVRLKKIEIVGNGDFIFAGDAARYDTSYSDFYAVRTDSNLNCPPIKVQNISQYVPAEFKLFQNYPNPFNPSTKIKFSIPAVGQRHSATGGFDVRMIVYDVLGREIQTLINQELKPGTYEVEWDGTNYPSGMYFYRLSTGSYSETKKMVLMK